MAGGVFELSPDFAGGCPGDDSVIVHVAQVSVVSHLLQHHPSFIYFVFGSSPFHHGARWVCDIPQGRLTKRIRIAIPNASSISACVKLEVIPQFELESKHIKRKRNQGKQPSLLGFLPVSATSTSSSKSKSKSKSSSSSSSDSDSSSDSVIEPASSWSTIVEPNSYAQVELVPVYHSSTPFIIRAYVDDSLCFEWSAVVLHQNNNQHKENRPDYRVPTVCRVGLTSSSSSTIPSHPAAVHSSSSSSSSSIVASPLVAAAAAPLAPPLPAYSISSIENSSETSSIRSSVSSIDIEQLQQLDLVPFSPSLSELLYFEQIPSSYYDQQQQQQQLSYFSEQQQQQQISIGYKRARSDDSTNGYSSASSSSSLSSSLSPSFNDYFFTSDLEQPFAKRRFEPIFEDNQSCSSSSSCSSSPTSLFDIPASACISLCDQDLQSLLSSSGDDADAAVLHLLQQFDDADTDSPILYSSSPPPEFR